MDQIWIRKENVFAWQWGLSDFELTEEQRPEFEGLYKKDEVSGKMKKYFQALGCKKFAKFIGFMVIFIFVGIVVGTLALIFIWKNQHKNDSIGTLAGVINAIQIKILNYVSIT